MKKLTALAGTGLLLLGSAGFAQDAAPATTVENATDAAQLPAGPETAALPPEASIPADDAANGELPASTDSLDASAPADGTSMSSEPTPGAIAYSDEQIASFAAAAMKIQELPGDEATKQDQAVTIVADSGLDPATFNAIGQAMQSDPAVAQRVQLAAASLQSKPEG